MKICLVYAFTTVLYCMCSCAVYCANITQVGHLPPSNMITSVSDIGIQNDYAYLVGGGRCCYSGCGSCVEGVLEIVTIDNPMSPAYTGGHFDTQTNGKKQKMSGVYVRGNYAYLCCDMAQWIKIVDIYNKSEHCGYISVSNTTGNAKKIVVEGNYAYVAADSGGLNIISIVNPANPELIGSLDTGDVALGIAVSGNFAYMAAKSQGLKIIDITTPNAPVLVGSFDTEGFVYDVAVVGNYAYLADYYNGLKIVNIVNPTTPTLASSFTTDGAASAVVVRGDYAYVAAYASGLQIVNTANPEAPFLAGCLDTDGTATGVVVEGDYVYLADGSGGLKIVQHRGPATVPKSGTEDTAITFSAADFTDHYIHLKEDSLIKVRIISLPNYGTLKLSGTAVTANQEIVVGDLDNLVFDPDTNWNGTTSFSWNGSDGASYASNPANVDITISSEQDAPTVSTITKSGTEDTSVTFVGTDFTNHFTDPDGDSLAKIQVISLPAHGTLKLSRTAVTANQEIVVGDLDNLVFDPEANWNGNTSFDWKGYDGIQYSTNVARVNIDIIRGETSPSSMLENSKWAWLLSIPAVLMW